MSARRQADEDARQWAQAQRLRARALARRGEARSLEAGADRLMWEALTTEADVLERESARLPQSGHLAAQAAERRASARALGSVETRAPGPLKRGARDCEAYREGLRNGRLDRGMGARSRYAEASPNTPYAEGYRRGVLGLDEPAGRAS